MARKFKRRIRVSDEIPSSALSDIAFLLLIFFLSTTTFSMEEGLVLSLPGQQSEVKKISRKNIMTILADASGQVSVDGAPVRISEIKQLVIDAQAENDKLVVVLETDPECYYGIMVDVLDEIQQARAERVALRTAGTAY